MAGEVSGTGLREGVRARVARWRVARDMRSTRPRRGPRLVQIGITERCNYRCLMCAAHSPLLRPPREEGGRPQLSLPVFRELVADLGRMEVGWIDLVGIGEPLLHPDFDEMAALAKAAGLKVNLSTNGSLLTPERAVRLAELGLDSMNVSINAGSEEVYQEVHQTARPGTRGRILEALQEMQAHCLRTGRAAPLLAMSAVLFKPSYGDLLPIVQAAAEVGAAHANFLPLMAVPDTEALALDEEEWRQARETLAAAADLAAHLGVHTNARALLAPGRPDVAREVHRRIPCYAGHVFGMVYADGSVRFCCGCDRTTGNLNERPFREIWRGQAYAALRRQALDLPRTGKAPEHCACFGYCPHSQHNLAVHHWLHPSAAPAEAFVMDTRFLPGPRRR